MSLLSGALLINKPPGISSFGVIDLLQRSLRERDQVKKKELPKLGHGGTLDPFATGLLIVLVGNGVKLARYFLGATKGYEGRMRFGETTIPGDPTAPISEKCDSIPSSLDALQKLAHHFTLQSYVQTPPMHSAKKLNGKPLYELARQGLEVEREAKSCQLYEFQIKNYTAPLADFQVKCSSGTYIRTLAQDYARLLGSLALLETLHRTSSGVFSIENAQTLDEVLAATQRGLLWDSLPSWTPFDRLLDGYDRAEATQSERMELIQGKQGALFNILNRTVSPERQKSECVAIYTSYELVAVARKESEKWGLERVFTKT